MAGIETKNNNHVATLWKNGTATALTDSSHWADANCVFVK